ncbi:hypothetical protein JG688_00015404 [Phytophthora aleatoria]|uniref:Uncharacterized protein n=1 Tax=Phytophthora aleatoria TaxID=2496075 RepID=A0A8J5IE94_9STRA|nr:hypothetical protein JG688_00015404 [Phytophthora aleatoria]
MSSDSEDGLNEVEDDEDPEELGDLDSGTESAEDDIVDEDKSDTKEESMDDDNTDGAADEDSQSDPNSPAAIAERHFTKKFLASLGGVDKVLASAKDMDKLREHSTTGWSDLVYPDLFEYIQTPLAKRIATLGYEKSRMDLRQKQSSVEIHP